MTSLTFDSMTAATPSAAIRTSIDYNDAIVRKFVIAALFWSIAAFLAGIWLAAELTYPQLNFGEYINFGRLRPLHTSAGVFAFGGNALIGTSFWVVQRTSRAKLFGGTLLPDFIFWGYNFFIVNAALGYLLGATE